MEQSAEVRAAEAGAGAAGAVVPVARGAEVTRDTLALLVHRAEVAAGFGVATGAGAFEERHGRERIRRHLMPRLVQHAERIARLGRTTSAFGLVPCHGAGTLVLQRGWSAGSSGS